MQKRQTILLILMGLAVIYAAYTLLGGDAAKAPAMTTAQDFKELLAGVNKAKAQNALTPVEQHRIALLSGRVDADPLLKRNPSDGGERIATRSGDTRFVYSGFISLGAQRLALINDSEYGEGDLVDESGYTLVAIDDAKVILQGRNPQTGQEDKVAIPIQEDIITFVEEPKNAQ